MIQIITAQSDELLRTMRRKVREGAIPEWDIDDENDFTYSVAPWRGKAWMRAKKTSSGIRLNMIGMQSVSVDREIYAIYHSRFLQMLLEHFDQLFEEATATALGTVSDLI